MNFISTRGKEKAKAAEAILSGYPKNGGLFVPESFPVFKKEELEEMLPLSYAERAAKVLAKFFGELGEEFLQTICEEAYETFEGDDPMPLVRIDEGKYILELYHGPTCACEDVAVSLYPALFDKSKELLKDDKKRMFLMATSGDAGIAALEVLKNREDVKAAVFYPEETIGKLQRIAICVAGGNNVYAAGIRGGFDACKEAVEKAYRSNTLSEGLSEKGYALTTLSSANIARVIPEVACFVSAYLDLLSHEQIEAGETVDFAVPVGNGCGIVAGLYAKKMGLPVRRILSSSNRNRAFYDVFKRGEIDIKRSFHHTMSPSMDVMFPSNLERILFEATGRDAKETEKRMKTVKEEGTVLTEEERRRLAQDFYAGFASEDDSVEAIYGVFEEYGYAMDTHTGIAAAVCDKVMEKRDEKDHTPIIIVSVGNPYKFPQDALYALSGNDVKDSFKGIKRLNLLTAMKPPKFLLELRYRLTRFKQILAADSKKVEDEVLALAGGKVVPEAGMAKK